MNIGIASIHSFNSFPSWLLLWFLLSFLHVKCSFLLQFLLFFTFRYCQLLSIKTAKNGMIDLLYKLQNVLKTLQDVLLFEQFLKDLEDFVQQFLPNLPVMKSIHSQLIKLKEDYQQSKTEETTSITNRMEQLKMVKNREELKKQLQVNCSILKNNL